MPLEVRLVCRDDSGAVVSPSSPEASRDEVCKALSGSAALIVTLLRLPLWEDAGDDIVTRGRKKVSARSGADAARLDGSSCAFLSLVSCECPRAAAAGSATCLG